VRVKVEYFASMRDKLGVKEEIMELPDGSSVEDLIERVKERLGESFEGRVLVNGKSVESLKGFKTELKDGDVVSLFPPIAGG